LITPPQPVYLNLTEKGMGRAVIPEYNLLPEKLSQKALVSLSRQPGLKDSRNWSRLFGGRERSS